MTKMILTILTVATCHSNFVHKDAHFIRWDRHLEAGELAVLPQVLRVVLAVVHWRPLHPPLLRDPRRPRGSGSERRLHFSGGALVRPAGGRRLSVRQFGRWAGGNRAVTRARAA